MAIVWGTRIEIKRFEFALYIQALTFNLGAKKFEIEIQAQGQIYSTTWPQEQVRAQSRSLHICTLHFYSLFAIGVPHREDRSMKQPSAKNDHSF